MRRLEERRRGQETAANGRYDTAMPKLKTVIHVHTHYSPDSNLSPRELLRAARREGIGCIAITDHDEIDGALEAHRLARDVRVIVGEEVSTTEGHLIGLYLRERIPPGLSPEETIRRIRRQGGLVLAPHPFTLLCSHSLRRATHRIAHELDAIEVVNSQNPLPWEDAWTARFARRRGIVPYVGSDSHLRGRLAPAYQMLPHFEDSPAGFMTALRGARLFSGRFGPSCWVRMGYQHVYRAVLRRPPRGYGEASAWGARRPGVGVGAVVEPEAPAGAA